MRIYQLILSQMQLHPCTRMSYHIERTINKGKKRAEDEDSDDYPDPEQPGGSILASPSPAKRARSAGGADVVMAAN